MHALHERPIGVNLFKWGSEILSKKVLQFLHERTLLQLGGCYMQTDLPCEMRSIFLWGGI